jgi:hypothetical protein
MKLESLEIKQSTLQVPARFAYCRLPDLSWRASQYIGERRIQEIWMSLISNGCSRHKNPNYRKE